MYVAAVLKTESPDTAAGIDCTSNVPDVLYPAGLVSRVIHVDLFLLLVFGSGCCSFALLNLYCLYNWCWPIPFSVVVKLLTYSASVNMRLLAHLHVIVMESFPALRTLLVPLLVGYLLYVYGLGCLCTVWKLRALSAS